MSLCGHPYEENEGYASVWREKWVIARKPHRCSECGGPIEPGDRHGYAVAIDADGVATWRRCTSCMLLAEAIAEKTDACPLWGGLANSADYADMPQPREWRERLEGSA